MATLKQMTDRVLDSSDRTISASRSEVNALINQAYVEVVMELRSTLTSAAFNIVSGQGDYTLAGLPILWVKYLNFTNNGNGTTLIPVTLEELLRLRNNPAVSGSTPYVYSLGGLNLISIYPSPSTADSATIYYYYKPTVLGSDSDCPPDYILPSQFHDLIVLRALSQSVRTIGKGSSIYLVSMRQAQAYDALYHEGIARLKSFRNRAVGSKGQRVQVGYTRRPIYTNDTYISPGSNNY